MAQCHTAPIEAVFATGMGVRDREFCVFTYTLSSTTLTSYTWFYKKQMS